MTFFFEKYFAMTIKLATFKKHILSNHSKQKCKICGKDFETSTKLMRHVSIEHNEYLKDNILNIILHSTPKSDKERQNFSFLFHESMLNEFLLVES